MEILHASAVAFGGRGALLIGSSGSGKSTLALELIASGGVLVADDRVMLERRDERLWIASPDTLAGRIEARGFGILNIPSEPAFASLVIDMDQTETARLPERKSITLAGVELPHLRKVESSAFPTMLRLYLEGARRE